MNAKLQRAERLVAILGVLRCRNLGGLESVDFRRRIVWVRHVRSDCRLGFLFRLDPAARTLAFAGCTVSIPRLPAPSRLPRRRGP